jgi:lysophospholipase L1-like esterase
MSPLLRGVVTALLVSVGVLLARTVARALAPWRAPADAPAAFLKHGRAPGTHTLVVCAGDSITHGVMSASYGDLLRDHRGGDGYEFVNAGINGNLAWNVLQRLDGVIACRPDAVTLLVGTNDVLATLGPPWESTYRRQQHIPVTPTLAWYRENVREIIHRLGAETGARLAILDLPPLGEDVHSEINGLVREYNEALREVAAEAGVEVLPLHDRLVALLPDNHTPPPFEGRRNLMGSALARRLVLRRSWDEVSEAHGLALLTDHVHLNNRSAAVVPELIAGWLAAPEDALRAPG